MKCEKCGGEIVFRPIARTGTRKPALKGKRVCEECGYWPAAHVIHEDFKCSRGKSAKRWEDLNG